MAGGLVGLAERGQLAAQRGGFVVGGQGGQVQRHRFRRRGQAGIPRSAHQAEKCRQSEA